jgi:aminomethyltransferase
VKRTAFHNVHKRLGGKIVEFAGFEMPVQYEGIIAEHRKVREAVGVFDVSHMGEIEVRGGDAFQFLQRVTINDVSQLFEGRVQYSAMCYDDGGIVDDLLVYHAGDHYMLVVNASNKDKDFDWLKDHVFGDVELNDVSDATSLLAVQGPRSLETLQKLTAVDLSSMKYYHFAKAKLADEEMIISRTGYTGELGFEMYFDADVTLSERIWNQVMEAGKEFGIAPIGLGARDTLRLEMGYCLYGNDIDRTTHPLEAGLGWITKLGKGDFIGRNAILKAKEQGLSRKRVGFVAMDQQGKAFPRHGYEIVADSQKIGFVTSGTFSPILEKGIGLGYVEVKYAEVGTEFGIVIRNKEISARTVRLPFVTR